MPRRLRRPLTALVVLVMLVLVALVGLTYPLFVFPATDEPGRADAVVVFAGGDGERQTEGLRLVRQGVAPVLVVSDGGEPDAPRARLCRQRPAGVRLYCFTPDPATTRGEARRFAELAGREGWRSLVLVTSNYHVLRAGLLLERCYDGQVRRVGTPLRNDHRWETGQQLAGEWLALGAALTVARSC
jgi:uncharacterized SAM-binding protein YcdF (DUF218 family)